MCVCVLGGSFESPLLLQKFLLLSSLVFSSFPLLQAKFLPFRKHSTRAAATHALLAWCPHCFPSLLFSQYLDGFSHSLFACLLACVLVLLLIFQLVSIDRTVVVLCMFSELLLLLLSFGSWEFWWWALKLGFHKWQIIFYGNLEGKMEGNFKEF